MNNSSKEALVSPVDRRTSSGIAHARAVELNRDDKTAYVIANEPSRIQVDDFRHLLMSAVLSGASDITISSDLQPRGEIYGILYRLTRRSWSPAEVGIVLMEVYGASNAMTEINAAKVLDFSYEVNMAGGKKQRFRVNATGVFGRDGAGVEITMRALPSDTPSLSSVSLTEDELDALTPNAGLVVIAGATGSGKSTTLAATLRSHLEDIEHPKKIVDLQAPIEYTYRDVTDSLKGSSSMIGQSEIGSHVKTFPDGVHSALRRKPHIIVVGESRDYATISASLEASLTGHLVYTTTHAGSASEAIRRLLSTFPANEREAKAYELISSLRFLMVQHLIPRIDKPGRVPVREYLKITERVRLSLLSHPIGEWPIIIGEEVSGRGKDVGPDDMYMSLADTAFALSRDGVISRTDAERLARKKMAEDQTALDADAVAFAKAPDDQEDMA